MRVIEGLGQHFGHLVDAMEGQPVLPHVERLRADQRRELGDRSRLPDDEVLLVAELCRAQEAAPVHARRLLVEVGALPRIVRGRALLARLQRLVRLRDLHLQRDDLLRPRLSVGETRERQDLGDVGRVVGAKLRHRRVGRDVIVAVRKPKATLHHVRHRAGRIVEVLRDENAEQILGVEVRIVERVGVGAERMADGVGERALVGNRLDLVDVGLRRREPALLDPGSVGVSLVIIGDPRLVAGRRVRIRDALDEVGRALLGLVVDRREDRDVRLVGRDDGFFSQVPLAYLSKSSPAFTDVSMSDLSIPDSVPWTASVPLAFPPVVLLHAASAIADAATIRIERFILGLSTVLPLPDVAATRAAGFFDQRTSLRHERTAHREQNRDGRG